MSNEVRRVPLDFDWPANKVWGGYVRPAEMNGEPCGECSGSGQTHFGWWLQTFSHVMGMLAEDVREQESGKPMHPWLREFPHPHGHWEYPVAGDPQSGPGRFIIDRPSADALDFFSSLMDVDKAEITGGLFGRSPQYAVMTKLLELTGTDVSCKACEGQGSTERYPGQRAEAEAWEPSGPPTGDGWQLWETVSEGSPVSPVFPSADALAAWMSDPERGDRWVPGDVARKFIDEGWAPTGAVRAGETPVSGVEFVGWAEQD
jgi:hypothetical protein